MLIVVCIYGVIQNNYIAVNECFIIKEFKKVSLRNLYSGYDLVIL